jgi:DNA topoisomerase-2
MHLFHPSKRNIQILKSPEEILKDFVDFEIDHYKKRKEHLIKVLQTRATMCGYKSKFVTMVIEGDIVVFKRKKRDDLERQLSQVLFPQIAGTVTTTYLISRRSSIHRGKCQRTLIQEAQATLAR